MNLVQVLKKEEALRKTHDEVTSELHKKKVAIIRKRMFTCNHCEEVSPLGLWCFVQDNYYISPSGCTEGDYWKMSATNVCHIVCPKCRKMNYIYNHKQKETLLDLLSKGATKQEIFTSLWEQHGDKLEMVFPKT